ncbi:unnamed protein product [marine sediment metagenome]|uniref:Uncharacterized protein n=1 Tax=marine sediment metagenome TaxID=412755 RepID=X1TVN8_9ZZZZ
MYTSSKHWTINPDGDPEKPPAGYRFYAFIALPFARFRECAEALGATVSELPQSPGRYSVEIHAPPDPQQVELDCQMGSYGEATLACALDAWYYAPQDPYTALDASRELLAHQADVPATPTLHEGLDDQH